jgi:hypothetical protein
MIIIIKSDKNSASIIFYIIIFMKDLKNPFFSYNNLAYNSKLNNYILHKVYKSN